MSIRRSTGGDSTVLAGMVFAFALGAALLFAVASVLQQRAASQAPGAGTVRFGLLIHLVKRPMWVAGYAADWAAFGLQALALGTGSLLIVQPLLVTGLLFALPFAAAWSGRRLGSHDWIAAFALCAGLGTFLLLGSPTGGVDRAPYADWVLPGGVVVGIAALALLAGFRTKGAARAAALALATGVAYGLTSALTKSSVDLVTNGVVALVTHWEPYVLVVMAGAGMVVNQAAFQAGELAASLPTLTIAEPIVAAVIGVSVLHERIQARGALDWFLIVVALGAMAYGVVVLAVRSAEVAKPAPEAVPAARPAR